MKEREQWQPVVREANGQTVLAFPFGTMPVIPDPRRYLKNNAAH
jgi:hypothetical protein